MPQASLLGGETELTQLNLKKQTNKKKTYNAVNEWEFRCLVGKSSESRNDEVIFISSSTLHFLYFHPAITLEAC